MLVGIDALLSGALLCALDEMGHGDALVIADANFPARRLAKAPIIQLVGVDAPTATRSILTVFPVDTSERIEIMRSPLGTQPVQEELLSEFPGEATSEVALVERHDFYALAETAALIIQTGDTRPYANLLIRKAGINRTSR